MMSNQGVISVCCVGDVVLRDECDPPVLALARPVLRAADIAFGNCESSYSERPMRNGAAGSAEGIIAHPRNVALLADAGFDAMTFANNHHMDCGDLAFFDTLDLLREQRIATCGAGRNIAEAREPAIVERNGVKVAFLGYSSILFPGYAAGPRAPGCAPMRIHTYYRMSEEEQPGSPALIETIPDHDDLRALQNDVAKAKAAADIVVVSPHWGVHFKPVEISPYETTVARAAIDAGADLVFGHHAHIMKGIQVYKGKAIIHSLGNFAFALPDMVKRGNWSTPNPTPRRLLYRRLYGEHVMNYYADSPAYPFHPDARRVGICRFNVENGCISRVSILPCYINKQGQPEPLSAAHERFAEVTDYLREISLGAGFDTRFDQVGDELVVVT